MMMTLMKKARYYYPAPREYVPREDYVPREYVHDRGIINYAAIPSSAVVEVDVSSSTGKGIGPKGTNPGKY